MAKMYMPSKDCLELLQSLMQGFLLDIDSNGVVALLVKVEASLCTSIINGTRIDIILRNPNVSKRSCTFYVYDIPENPFYAVGKNFSNEDSVMKGFDEIAIKLALSKKIIICLFNEFTHPIFTTELEIENSCKDFDEWLFNIYNRDAFKYTEKKDLKENYFPENQIKGYSIKIKNIDNSETEKLIILGQDYDEKWRQESPSIKKYFKHDDYVGDGKHGYYQETSIANNLSRFFRPEIDFFINPTNIDNTEFTDFIIIHKNTAFLIESKYVISNKKTKQHAAVTKGVNQLYKAEKTIKEKKVHLNNTKLSNLLNNIDYVMKICMVNDKLIVTDENSQVLTEKYRKEDLPLFISVTSFFDMVASFALKNEPFILKNMAINYLRLQQNYLNSAFKIWYIREFSLEGLTSDELNELGRLNRKL